MGFKEEILEAINEGIIETEKQKKEREKLRQFLKKFHHNGIMKG